MAPSVMLIMTFLLSLACALLAQSTQSLNSYLLRVTNPFSAQLDPNKTLAIIEGAFPFSPFNNSTAGVRIPSGWSFSIGFQSFVSVEDGILPYGSPQLYFRAAIHFDDNSTSELPPWLDFANDALAFSGTAPENDSNGVTDQDAAQTIESLQILVYCALSPSWDKSTWYTSDAFLLIVLRHVLEMKSGTIEIGSTARRSVTKDLERMLTSVLTIDGHAVSNLSSIRMDLDLRNQSWLHWDRFVLPAFGLYCMLSLYLI